MDKELKQLEQEANKIASSKDKSIDFLFKMGINTKSGKLTKRYK